jgi:hypothetical protein
MLAFGQQMEEFHDFTTACISTLIVISKGSSDIYQKQFQIDPLVSSVWHWLLVCIMTMVLLHLVFCILVESFAEAQAAALAEKVVSDVSPPTLLEQIIETKKYVVACVTGHWRHVPAQSISETKPTVFSKKDFFRRVEPNQDPRAFPLHGAVRTGRTRTLHPSSIITRDFSSTESMNLSMEEAL